MPAAHDAPAGDHHDAALAERRVKAFLGTLERVLADEATGRLVGQAAVTVRVELIDRPGHPLHLLFDRVPAQASVFAQTQRPDVILELHTADLDCFLNGGADLPLRILSGQIRFEGYVRKLLRVLPILRAAAAGP